MILINWNSYYHTANCIQSLKQCVGHGFDILVVDNGSQDGSIQKLKHEFGDVIYLPFEKNLGFAGGNNRGFEYVLKHDYEYVMMLNNDVFVEPSFMFHLINYMVFHPETGAIQPKIFFNDNRLRIWNGGSRYASFFGWAYSRNYMREEGNLQSIVHEVDWITGCALLVRTSILKEIGLLNENYFIYYEDVDFSFRIKKAGYSLIFHPDSVIYHIAGMSHKAKSRGPEGYSNPIVHYLNFRNHLWLMRSWNKWYHWPTTLITYFTYSLGVMTYFVLRFRRKKLAAVCRGIFDGFFKSYTL